MSNTSYTQRIDHDNNNTFEEEHNSNCNNIGGTNYEMCSSNFETHLFNEWGQLLETTTNTTNSNNNNLADPLEQQTPNSPNYNNQDPYTIDADDSVDPALLHSPTTSNLQQETPNLPTSSTKKQQQQKKSIQRNNKNTLKSTTNQKHKKTSPTNNTSSDSEQTQSAASVAQAQQLHTSQQIEQQQTHQVAALRKAREIVNKAAGIPQLPLPNTNNQQALELMSSIQQQQQFSKQKNNNNLNIEQQIEQQLLPTSENDPEYWSPRSINKRRGGQGNRSHNLAKYWDLVNSKKLWVGESGHHIFPYAALHATTDMFNCKFDSTNRKMRKKGFVNVTRYLSPALKKKCIDSKCWLLFNRRALHPDDKNCKISLLSPSNASREAWIRCWNGAATTPVNKAIIKNITTETEKNVSKVLNDLPSIFPNNIDTVTPDVQEDDISPQTNAAASVALPQLQQLHLLQQQQLQQLQLQQQHQLIQQQLAQQAAIVAVQDKQEDDEDDVEEEEEIMQISPPPTQQLQAPTLSSQPTISPSHRSQHHGGNKSLNSSKPPSPQLIKNLTDADESDDELFYQQKQDLPRPNLKKRRRSGRSLPTPAKIAECAAAAIASCNSMKKPNPKRQKITLETLDLLKDSDDSDTASGEVSDTDSDSGECIIISHDGLVNKNNNSQASSNVIDLVTPHVTNIDSDELYMDIDTTGFVGYDDEDSETREGSARSTPEFPNNSTTPILTTKNSNTKLSFDELVATKTRSTQQQQHQNQQSTPSSPNQQSQNTTPTSSQLIFTSSPPNSSTQKPIATNVLSPATVASSVGSSVESSPPLSPVSSGSDVPIEFRGYTTQNLFGRQLFVGPDQKGEVLAVAKCFGKSIPIDVMHNELQKVLSFYFEHISKPTKNDFNVVVAMSNILEAPINVRMLDSNGNQMCTMTIQPSAQNVTALKSHPVWSDNNKTWKQIYDMIKSDIESVSVSLRQGPVSEFF